MRPAARAAIRSSTFWTTRTAYVAWLSSDRKHYRLISGGRENIHRAQEPRRHSGGGRRFAPTRQTMIASANLRRRRKGANIRQRSVPVDTFATNSFGLHQVPGNVSEGSPIDGAAFHPGRRAWSGVDHRDCGRRSCVAVLVRRRQQLRAASPPSAFYPGLPLKTRSRFGSHGR